MVQATDAKGIQETFERAATAWWDAWARSPAFLGHAGRLLEAQLGIGRVARRAMDEWLEAWRIPSAREQEALLERIAALEARVEALARTGDDRHAAEGAPGRAAASGAGAAEEMRREADDGRTAAGAPAAGAESIRVHVRKGDGAAPSASAS
jgi:hypothetical protein